MAYWSFTEAMLKGETLKIFNKGDMKRDFTYIDDIVSGILKVLKAAPTDGGDELPPYRIYNIGNHQSEPLMNLVKTLENSLGLSANLEFLPMQKGDVKETFADISPLQKDVGYEPVTSLDVGIPKFVDWYKNYNKEN